MRVPLATVPPCTGCGNCCRHIGMPPFEVANPDLGVVPVAPTPGGWYTEMQSADTDTFARMPADLRAEHAALVRALTEDPTGKPCAWLDPDTGACRHYEYRPEECRVFVVGSEECVALKYRANTSCVWHENDGPDVWRNPRSRPLGWYAV